MKKISFLLPERCLPTGLTGPMEMFNAASEYMMNKGLSDGPFFEIETIGLTKNRVSLSSNITIKCDRSTNSMDSTDLIIIPPFRLDDPAAYKNNLNFIPWIKYHYQNSNADVASICLGSFLLASTGLLDGKVCTTHWHASEKFERLFPNVNFCPNQILTNEERLYTSGGVTSFLSLVILLIEKYCGRETSIWVSKRFLVDVDRVTQSYFAIFNTQKKHQDKSIQTAQEYIENNYQNEISVEGIAKKVSISRRNFIRRFKKATNNTPLEYIQRVKIEAAKKKLENSSETIYNIMFSVGYNDNKSFRNRFKKITGLTPKEYRKKYNSAYIIHPSNN